MTTLLKEFFLIEAVSQWPAWPTNGGTDEIAQLETMREHVEKVCEIEKDQAVVAALKAVIEALVQAQQALEASPGEI